MNHLWIPTCDYLIALIFVSHTALVVVFFYSKFIDGTYRWHSFDLTTNTSVYHCPQCWNNQSGYLFAWIQPWGHYWQISDSMGPNAVSACNFYAQSVANVVDCNTWYTLQNEWISDKWMTVDRCSDAPHSTDVNQPSTTRVCVFGSLLRSLEGEYIFLNGSTHYNAETQSYFVRLNQTLSSERYGIITQDNTLKSYCIHDCLKNWFVSVNGSWMSSPSMRLVDCDPICIEGNNITWLDGVYTWSHFDYATNSSTYHCSDCTQSGVYLYGWIYSSGVYNWRLLYQNKNVK
eukprot:112940_1